VRPEGLSHWKTIIESPTFWLAAPCLNHLQAANKLKSHEMTTADSTAFALSYVF
jgi:hypothetical protein